MDCHELYEKSGKIASPPAGGSQNPYTYYALMVYTNFNRKKNMNSSRLMIHNSLILAL